MGMVAKCDEVSQDMIEMLSDGGGALPGNYNDIASTIAMDNPLHKLWLDGVKTAQCVLSQNNRPSLKSWKGWPWEEQHVMKRLLLGSRSGYKTIAPDILV